MKLGALIALARVSIGCFMSSKTLTGNFLDDFISSGKLFNFWFFQIIGWTAFSLVTFLTLTVWYEQVRIEHVFHIILQAFFGVLFTMPMRYFGRHVWQKPRISLIALNVIIVLVFAILWTVMRMQTFLWIAEEYDIWEDFGGWAFGSIFVFTSWMAFYHAIKTLMSLQSDKETLRLSEMKANEEKIKRLTAENLAQENRVKILRYQDNPHFLFNSLNSLTGLIAMKRNDEAMEMIQSLASLLRLSLDLDPMDDISLEEEVKIIEKYLNMQRVRYGEDLIFNYEISAKAKQVMIPNLILLPIFENIFKHALPFNKSNEKFYIELSAKLSQQKLIITVENSGAISPEDLQKISSNNSSKSIGLPNLKERLAVIYGAGFSLDAATSKLGGLKIQLELGS